MTTWTTRTRVAVLWDGCDLHKDIPFWTWGSSACTRLRSQETPSHVWLGLLISSWRFLMKLLLPSRAAQSRDLALLASPWAEVFPAGTTTTLFSSSTDAQAGKLCQTTRALSALALEKFLFLPSFGDLCFISTGEELVYDSWLEREAEPESFDRDLRVILAAGAVEAQAGPWRVPSCSQATCTSPRGNPLLAFRFLCMVPWS